MAKSEEYKVPVKFIFEGEFIVKANSAAEARDIVSDECHLVMGQSIECHADEVSDWDFDMHSEKVIGRVTRNVYRL